MCQDNTHTHNHKSSQPISTRILMPVFQENATEQQHRQD